MNFIHGNMNLQASTHPQPLSRCDTHTSLTFQAEQTLVKESRHKLAKGLNRNFSVGVGGMVYITVVVYTVCIKPKYKIVQNELKKKQTTKTFVKSLHYAKHHLFFFKLTGLGHILLCIFTLL